MVRNGLTCSNFIKLPSGLFYSSLKPCDCTRHGWGQSLFFFFFFPPEPAEVRKLIFMDKLASFPEGFIIAKLFFNLKIKNFKN